MFRQQLVGGVDTCSHGEKKKHRRKLTLHCKLQLWHTSHLTVSPTCLQLCCLSQVSQTLDHSIRSMKCTVYVIRTIYFLILIKNNRTKCFLHFFYYSVLGFSPFIFSKYIFSQGFTQHWDLTYTQSQ